METMKKSEEVFNLAVNLDSFVTENKDSLSEEMRLKIQEKISVIFDRAIKIEENENAKAYNEKMAGEYNIAKEDNEEEIVRLSDEAFSIFDDMTLNEKVEFKDTISGHLKRALELLLGKGKNAKRVVVDKSKDIIDGMSQTVGNMYDSTIEFQEQKIAEIKDSIEAKKAAKEAAKKEAIEQLKALGEYDVLIDAYETEKDDIDQEIDELYEAKEQVEEKMKLINKNKKALIKAEKKGFFSRLISNFSALSSKPELTDEERMNLIENGGVEKSGGFFGKLKQAFSKTREQSKDIKSKNLEFTNKIMSKYEDKQASINEQINEDERVLVENEQELAKTKDEKKEKLVEIVKTGKLKTKDLQEMIDNEILICSNPRMIVAQARASKLKDKLARVFSWGKEKEEEKEVVENGFRAPTEQDLENKTPKGVAALNKDSANMDMVK